MCKRNYYLTLYLVDIIFKIRIFLRSKTYYLYQAVRRLDESVNNTRITGYDIFSVLSSFFYPAYEGTLHIEAYYIRIFMSFIRSFFCKLSGKGGSCF